MTSTHARTITVRKLSGGKILLRVDHQLIADVIRRKQLRAIAAEEVRAA